MMFRPILAAWLFAIVPPAFADEAAMPTPTTTPAPSPSATPTLDAEEQATLQKFGAAHPECKEWNDGCATCARDTAVHCSTPGIACLPADIVCKAP